VVILIQSHGLESDHDGDYGSMWCDGGSSGHTHPFREATRLAGESRADFTTRFALFGHLLVCNLLRVPFSKTLQRTDSHLLHAPNMQLLVFISSVDHALRNNLHSTLAFFRPTSCLHPKVRRPTLTSWRLSGI
jgi:hypothetical protein